MTKNRFAILLFFFYLVFIFYPKKSFGQEKNNVDFFNKKRFNAAFVVGFNSSELAGEGLDNFIGWNAGILGAIDLTKNFHLSIELLFSQNGDYLTPEFFPDLEFSKVHLNFVEIPLQVNYQLQQNKELSDRKGWIRGGFAFAHLIDTELVANEIEISNLVIWEKENAWLVNFGGTFFFSKHLGVNVKMSFPLVAKGLTPTFAFRGIYLL